MPESNAIPRTVDAQTLYRYDTESDVMERLATSAARACEPLGSPLSDFFVWGGQLVPSKSAMRRVDAINMTLRDIAIRTWRFGVARACRSSGAPWNSL